MIEFTDLGDLDPDSIDSDNIFSDDSIDHNDDLLENSEHDIDYYEFDTDDGLIDDRDIERTESLISDSEDNTGEINSPHKHYSSSNISFTGNGRCRVCNCGGWAGFGDTCENCGHFYNKHI